MTPYPYPDNDLIEVFVEDIGQGRVRVSDLGEAPRQLFDQGPDIGIARKRKELVQTVAAGRGVDVVQGQLVREVKVGDIGELLFDVIVTARGVAGIILTSRTYEPATFEQEVAHLFSSNQVDYESDVPVTGRSGKTYRVTFRLAKSGQLIETVSPNQPAGRRPVFNRVLRVWVDVNGDLGRDRKVSLLNDLDFRWGEPEMALLQTVSRVAYWSQRDDWVTDVAQRGGF